MRPNLAAIILTTLAVHLRRCAVLTDDPFALDVIISCARDLEDRSQQLRAEKLNGILEIRDPEPPH